MLEGCKLILSMIFIKGEVAPCQRESRGWTLVSAHGDGSGPGCLNPGETQLYAEGWQRCLMHEE